MLSSVAYRLEKSAARRERRRENAAFLESLGQAPKKATRRRKRLSVSKIEAIRWEAFATIIKDRDKDKGCFVCKTGPVEHAGHTVPRGRRAVKYHEENVHGWCADCNLMDHKTPGYHDWAVLQHMNAYSLGHYESLVNASREVCQESRQDKLSSAWNFIQRMPEGDRKEKLRRKIAPYVPAQYGGELR